MVGNTFPWSSVVRDGACQRKKGEKEKRSGESEGTSPSKAKCVEVFSRTVIVRPRFALCNHYCTIRSLPPLEFFFISSLSCSLSHLAPACASPSPPSSLSPSIRFPISISLSGLNRRWTIRRYSRGRDNSIEIVRRVSHRGYQVWWQQKYLECLWQGIVDFFFTLSAGCRRPLSSSVSDLSTII